MKTYDEKKLHRLAWLLLLLKYLEIYTASHKIL
jgi:hypothetical protein